VKQVANQQTVKQGAKPSRGKKRRKGPKEELELHPQVRHRRAYIKWRQAQWKDTCVRVLDDSPATQRQHELLNEQWREQLRLGLIKPIDQYVEEDADRADARRRIHYVSGHWYARPLRAQALGDVAELLWVREIALPHVMGIEPTLHGRATLVRRASTCLVEEQVPARLLRCIARQLEVRR
jgi:hypothetical protein